VALCSRHCGKADLLAYAFSVLICLYAALRVNPYKFKEKLVILQSIGII